MTVRALVVLLLAIVAAASFYTISTSLSGYPPVAKIMTLGGGYIEPLFDALIVRVLVAVGVLILTINYGVVLRFVRRSLTPTDELVIGKWYVYRYTKTNGQVLLLADLWTVHRNMSLKYAVSIVPLGRHRRIGNKGLVVCNERDRFSILLDSAYHKEQSLIAFSPRIPSGGDSRILGLGVGDDADYVLSARIYLASRNQLPVDHVKVVIDDASSAIKSGSNDQLIQLPSHMISEILLRNELPQSAKPEIESPSRNRFLRLFKRIFNRHTHLE